MPNLPPARNLARALQRNIGPQGIPGEDWWGQITAISNGPPYTVAASVNGLTSQTVVCRVANAYAALVPLVGDTVVGRRDRRGDYWVLDRMTVNGPGWQPFSYSNSWASAGGPGAGGTVAGYRLEGDTVRMAGSIKSGATGNAFATLPAGYRPTYAICVPAVGVSTGGALYAAADVQISVAGVCTPNFQSPGFAVFALDGITFTVD